MEQYDYLIIDSSSLLNTLYHGYKKMEEEGKSKVIMKKVNGEQIYTSTLRHYLQQIYELRKMLPNTIFIHALDPATSEKNFRKEIDPNYKTNRIEKEERLEKQLELLPKFLSHLGEIYFQSSIYEADDVIATIVSNNTLNNKKTLIYSKDKDLLQLMFDENLVHFLTKVQKSQGLFNLTTIKTFEEVKNKLGVYPHLVADLLAIKGDVSDNIIGVKGVGDVTASNILNSYGHLVDIIDGLQKSTLQMEEKYKKFFTPENVEIILKNLKLSYTKDDIVFPKSISLENQISNYFNKDIKEGVSLVSRLIEIKPEYIFEIKQKQPIKNHNLHNKRY